MSHDAGSDGSTSEHLSRLSDRELRRAWRTSGHRLRELEMLADVRGVARVVRERARYLEELQRRDPEGFDSWLTVNGCDPADRRQDVTRFVPQQRRPTEG